MQSSLPDLLKTIELFQQYLYQVEAQTQNSGSIDAKHQPVNVNSKEGGANEIID